MLSIAVRATVMSEHSGHAQDTHTHPLHARPSHTVTTSHTTSHAARLQWPVIRTSQHRKIDPQWHLVRHPIRNLSTTPARAAGLGGEFIWWHC